MPHSTHPHPQHHPHPVNAANVSDASPAGAPDPAVPLALWLTPTDPATGSGDTGWVVPPLLAQNLIGVYTSPGGTVLATGGSAHLIARTAARLGRQPAPRTGGNRPAAGTVDLLVITANPTGQAPVLAGDGRSPMTDPVVWRRWTRLLSPPGVAAVVLPATRAPGDPAAVIATAVGAGLTYLQHIPALTWPLHEDHLDPPDPTGHIGQGRPVGSAHLDVLIFTGEAVPTQSDRTPPTPATPDRGGAAGTGNPPAAPTVPAPVARKDGTR